MFVRTRFGSRYAAIAVLLYCAVAGYGGAFQHPEVFPFFNWSLFSTPPKVVEDWSVKITSVNGRRLEEPRWIEYLPQQFSEYGISQSKQLLEWGQRLDRGDAAGADRQRQLFENLFANLNSVEYTLYKRRARPLVRWHEGDFDALEPHGSFRWKRKAGVPRD